MFINATEDQASRVISFDRFKVGCVVRVVGTLAGSETVTFQIPAVAEPDAETDADWQDLMFDGAVYLLDTTTNARACPFRCKMRIVKSATTAAVGVEVE